MKPNTRLQLEILGVFLLIYALLAGLSIWLTPADQMSAPMPMPLWQLALANAAIVLFAYGLFGAAGIWLARKLEIPGVFRAGAGWKAWAVWPMLIGVALGVVLVIADQVFVSLGSGQSFPHPAFPLSLVASATAGIGEEILFRGFVMGAWALLFHILLRGRRRKAALWIGNALAALAFSAGHLPAVMYLLNAATPAAIPPLLLAELFVLNGLMGLVAGERYMRDGLVAAMGVHFWADVVWHVIMPVLLPAA